MRVLLVTPWYPTEDNPAAGAFVREHARAAAHLDEVALVHLVPSKSKRVRLEDVSGEGFPVVRAYYPDIRFTATPFGAAAIHLAAGRLRQRGFSPDLVHAHVIWATIPAAVYCRLHGRPLVVTEQSTIYLAADPETLGRSIEVQLRWALRRAARILPVGATLAVAMRRFAPVAEFEVVPNIVDCELFHPPFRVPAAPPVRLIAVGLLGPQKNYPILFRVIRRVLDADVPIHLDVVGYGPLANELAREVDALRLQEHVEFAGYLPKERLAERLRESHLLVHASAFETFAAVVAEALAVGLPVVVTRSGGPEDYVNPGAGRIVEPGDVEAFAEAICSLAGGLQQIDRQRIAEDARRRFSAQAVGEQLHRIYEMAADESAAATDRP